LSESRVSCYATRPAHPPRSRCESRADASPPPGLASMDDRSSPGSERPHRADGRAGALRHRTSCAERNELMRTIDQHLPGPPPSAAPRSHFHPALEVCLRCPHRGWLHRLAGSYVRRVPLIEDIVSSSPHRAIGSVRSPLAPYCRPGGFEEVAVPAGAVAPRFAIIRPGAPPPRIRSRHDAHRRAIIHPAP
jgi:hypothetical protein